MEEEAGHRIVCAHLGGEFGAFFCAFRGVSLQQSREKARFQQLTGRAYEWGREDRPITGLLEEGKS